MNCSLLDNTDDPVVPQARITTLRINSTGFVAAEAGSVASANLVLLRGLLDRGHYVHFFTKPSFVDPRHGLKGMSLENLTVNDCTNSWEDEVRRTLAPSGRGIWGRALGSIDAFTYNRKLVGRMRSQAEGDLDLWLGDWARGRGQRPVISFVQGPPGTDARSVERHERLIVDLAGRFKFEQLRMYARYRLSFGLPPFAPSDHVIVGSEWSRSTLIHEYGFKSSKVHACPYPIDLQVFRPASSRPRKGRLRVLWLGRFVPRKRLDLFLDGLCLAIEQGVDVEAWVVGNSGFVPGFEKLLDKFRYQDRLRTWPSIPRQEVPTILAEVDLMAQPSEQEDFGSSVAEALACGVPVVVGSTNGTGNYVCEQSVRLADYSPEAFAASLHKFAEKKRAGELVDRTVSRSAAERWFDPEIVVDRLEAILQAAIDRTPSLKRANIE